MLDYTGFGETRKTALGHAADFGGGCTKRLQRVSQTFDRPCHGAGRGRQNSKILLQFGGEGAGGSLVDRGSARNKSPNY